MANPPKPLDKIVAGAKQDQLTLRNNSVGKRRAMNIEEVEITVTYS